MPNTIAVLALSGLAAGVGSYVLRGRHKRQGAGTQVGQDDWIAHDGTGCPFAPQAKPAVIFRSGWTSDAGLRPAESWDQCWTWASPGALDIIAYKPAPD